MFKQQICKEFFRDITKSLPREMDRATEAVVYIAFRVVGFFGCVWFVGFFFLFRLDKTRVCTHICGPWNAESSARSDGFRCQNPSEKVNVGSHWLEPNPVSCVLLILSFGGGWEWRNERKRWIPTLDPRSSWCLGIYSWAYADCRLGLRVLPPGSSFTLLSYAL